MLAGGDCLHDVDGDAAMTIDVDTTIVEVHGDHKQAPAMATPHPRLPPAAGHPRRHRRGAAGWSGSVWARGSGRLGSGMMARQAPASTVVMRL
jgi:hypothetical protein